MCLTAAKVVGGQTYVHVHSLSRLRPDTAARLAAAEGLARASWQVRFNLVRMDDAGACVALLNYPEFHDDPFPSLRESWLVDLARSTVSYRTYAASFNPPILHRKELLLLPDDPRRQACAALTAEAEAIGLFDEPHRIGHRRQWLALVRDKGYRIDGHQLLPIGNDESASPGDDEAPGHHVWQASRQLTALARYGFSAPIQSLGRYGFLDGSYRLFDYGCGRGDDVRGLRDIGVSASGWDPYYAPDNRIEASDVVNLGFVINVIENLDERLHALTRAWSLAKHLLVVSVMLANQNDPRGEPYRDGVLTQRGTFQKYFSQSEIKRFLEEVLDVEAIPVSPGVLYVFRDQEAGRRFLADRYLSRVGRARERFLRTRAPQQENRRDLAGERYAAYREPLDRLWGKWLALGRRPDKTEVEDLVALGEGFGSLSKALRFLEERHGLAPIQRAAALRIADLEVCFALAQFEPRKQCVPMERGLQRDIRHFFGDHSALRTNALALLFQVSNIDALDQACREAAESGLGCLDPGKSLQVHISLVDRLPTLLRVYLGCAARIYGDYRGTDLVKFHIRSGKVSLLRFDDFEAQPLPRLLERVKIKLREQEIEYFAYGGNHEPPFLFHKSRYVNEEFPGYPEQLAFERALDALGLFDWSGYGPASSVFQATMARHRWHLEGFAIARSRTIPGLDDACGRFLTFRQLIECGETQTRSAVDNLPLQPESYNALADLAERVLDPVIDYFGMIRLTYGFCSAQLAKRVPARIHPRLDQHAAHERNRCGVPICRRLGAAADFIVDDIDMLEVAQWLIANTPFDRLYFYGGDKPIHVSYGPDHKREIVRMDRGNRGRLLPRVVAELVQTD